MSRYGCQFLKAIALLAILGVSFSYGYLARRDRLFPHELVVRLHRLVSSERPGLWAESSSDSPSPNSLDLDALAALGYLSGSESAPARTGVLIHKEDMAFSGYNLFTSGHAPQAILMGMDGQVVHTWQYDIGAGQSWWRRTQLSENGDLLALVEHGSLMKLDKDSNLLWEFNDNVHHDMDVAKDGSIYVLTRKEVDYEDLCDGEVMWDDFISVLGQDGNLRRRISILEAFVNSEYAPLFKRLLNCNSPSEELFHTNTLELITEESEWTAGPIFSKGRALISFRELDTIGVIDIDTGRMAWALTGMWKLQHQPTLLASGNILLFDNVTRRGFSRVIELDPFSQELRWAFEGNEENGFSSEVLGSNQRLANGNTLIVESTAGRVFEVTSKGNIVWEFVNPMRALDDDTLIAVIPDLVRLPPDLPLDWLRRSQ